MLKHSAVSEVDYQMYDTLPPTLYPDILPPTATLCPRYFRTRWICQNTVQCLKWIIKCTTLYPPTLYPDTLPRHFTPYCDIIPPIFQNKVDMLKHSAVSEVDYQMYDTLPRHFTPLLRHYTPDISEQGGYAKTQCSV